MDPGRPCGARAAGRRSGGWDDCFGLNAHRAADGRLLLDADVLEALGLDAQRLFRQAPAM